MRTAKGGVDGRAARRRVHGWTSRERAPEAVLLRRCDVPLPLYLHAAPTIAVWAQTANKVHACPPIPVARCVAMRTRTRLARKPHTGLCRRLGAPAGGTPKTPCACVPFSRTRAHMRTHSAPARVLTLYCCPCIIGRSGRADVAAAAPRTRRSRRDGSVSACGHRGRAAGGWRLVGLGVG